MRSAVAVLFVGLAEPQLDDERVAHTLGDRRDVMHLFRMEKERVASGHVVLLLLARHVVIRGESPTRDLVRVREKDGHGEHRT